MLQTSDVEEDKEEESNARQQNDEDGKPIEANEKNEETGGRMGVGQRNEEQADD